MQTKMEIQGCCIEWKPKRITDYSLDELEQEINRRKSKPEPNPNPDWSHLVSWLLNAIECKATGKGEPKDFEPYCMELALEALYGDQIWNWWNDR